MAKKRKAPAKKPGKAKKSIARSAPAKAPKRKPRTRVARPRSAGRASRGAPGGNSHGSQFVTFDEAKSAAIDALIRVIEDSERRLSAVKRAGTYDELKKLSRGPDA